MLLLLSRGTSRCLQVMRANKVYLLLVLVPYLFLLLIFHFQLQVYDHSPVKSHTSVDDNTQLLNWDANPQAAAGLVKNDKGSYHFRDLMLKETNNDLYVAKSDHDKQVRQTQLDDPRHSESFRFNKDAPDDSNDTLRVARVSRTFQNGTRQVVEGPHNPLLGAVRLELEGGSDTISRAVKEKVMGYYRDNNGSGVNDKDSVILPLSTKCWKYYKSRKHILEEAGFFHYVSGAHILSAFLDSRISTEPPFVRITAMLKRSHQPELYCHFPYQTTGGDNSEPGYVSNKDNQTLYATELALYYEMCENHNKEYGGWIISCKVPSVFTDNDETPCELIISKQSIFSAQSLDNANIPIFTTSFPHPESLRMEDYKKEHFAVCVPPLFGHIPSTTLVEFVELSRLLGAGHVVFYAHQVTSAIQKVLEYYQEQGMVSVISWELPVRDKHIWYHGQLLAINDCLYRSMHRFSHVIFNDIDEFLVPHRHDSWLEMAQHLDFMNTTADNASRMSGYTFQSAFFDPLVNGNSKILYDLESDLRTKTFSAVRSKVMVRPQWVFELGIHHISRSLTPSFRHMEVPTSLAFIHHYRKCMMDFDPHMKCQVYARDESLSPFIPSLRHNVHETLWVLKEIDKLGRKSAISRYL